MNQSLSSKVDEEKALFGETVLSETCQTRSEIKIRKNRDEMRSDPFSELGLLELESFQTSQVGVSQPIVLRSSLEASLAAPTAKRKLEGQAYDFDRGLLTNARVNTSQSRQRMSKREALES